MKIFTSLLSATFITLVLLSNSLLAQNQNITLPSNCVASPDPVVINQPNGTSLTVIGRGNMNNNWTETVDGYTVKRNSNGVYEYALKQGNKLVPGGTLASDPQNRSLTEQTYVAGLQASLKPNMNPLKASILNQVNSHLQNKTFPTTGNIRVLALLIDYPDLVNVIPKADFDSLMYGANYRAGDGSFKAFYETSSGGQLTVTVDVKGWYRAANNYLHYAADSGYDRAASLVKEAVDAAELAGTDFSLYDNDNDGDVDGILAVHSGPGAEIGSQTQYIWSHRWNFFSAGIGSSFYDGVSISDYMINPEVRSASNQNISGIGVICHEFGHNLGLPDLYDTDNTNGDSEGIGNWCLMAGGSYLGSSNRPANFSAWCRIENGWDTPTQLTIGNTGSYTLPAASTSRDEIFQINTALTNEYFLLENRQQVGRDSDLPGTGLAIWHINTNKTNAFGNSVNADETMKGVDLEEADGNDDLDNEVNRGDGGDLYPGTSLATTFDDNSYPSANTYTLANTGIEIRNITENAGVISFDFGAVPGPPCAATTTLTTATGSFSDGSGAGMNYANNQSCSWLIQPPSGTVTLSFSTFDTQLGEDSVTVYDGPNNASPVLGSFSGTILPPNVTSSSNVMYVEFNTNATINASGWDASYISNIPPTPCSGTTNLTAASGTFSDGSGASNYGNNLNCSWLIQPPGATTITFGLSSLTTEINNDRIIIYDGPNSSSPQLGSYSGTNNLNTLTSSGGSIFVVFTTNGSVTDQGWDAFYSSSTAGPGCTGATTFTSNSGSFSDGSMANNYDNNQFCSWLIQPAVSGTITLSFSAFATEPNLDRVIVFDGVDNTAPQIGNFSGSNIPGNLTSTSNAMYIEFRTNGSVTDQGWDASYVTNVSSTPTCTGTTNLTAASGTFDDGSGVGTNYSDNLNCSWLIQPPGANGVTLTFNSFDTELNTDFLRIYNGTSNSAPLIGTFSGSSTPPSVSATSGSMFVEFITDGTNNSTGWEASYVASNPSTCSGTTTFTTPTGTFDDGSGNSNYDNNLNCNWLIQPAGATQIRLTFNSFNTENNFDFVRVFDGSSASAPLLGIFDGTTIPSPITSSGGSLFVQFTTDISATRSGWSATYNSTNTQCFPNQTLTASTGNISDGSGTSNYQNNLDCSWLIQPLGATSVTANFNSFNVNSLGDTLYLYDGNSSSGTLLGAYTGATLPSSVTANSGSMFVSFITDASSVSQGWDLSYTSISPISCSGLTTLTAASGSFDDGSGAGNYSNNVSCTWLIQPAGSPASITLTMNSMNLVDFQDRVRVFDGTNNGGTLIGNFFFNNTGSPVIAYSGSMFIEFTTNSSNTGSGWDASYTSSSTFCSSNTTFTTNNGNFNDGSPFAQNYLPNTDCAWLIQPSTPNVAVNLNFSQFTTELNNDTVTVYDGATTSDPILGTFSGINPTFPNLLSSGGSMLVTFKSNGSSQANGWSASYNTQAIPACSGTTVLTAANGTFDDGTNSSTNYVNNLNCSWLIQPPGASIVSLSFNRFNTQNGDIVTVYDGANNTAPILGSFSGSNLPGNIISSGGSLFVEFTSNAFSTSNGWEIDYNSSTSQCLSNLLITAYNGNVSDRSGTSNYQNNLNCSWLIQPPSATSITATFNTFDLNSPGDTLFLYDGTTSAATLIGAYTGNSLPPNATTTGGSMFVEFITDGATTDAGWDFDYTTATPFSCIGTTTFIAAMGNFNDGSGANNYDNNLNCSWLIQPTGSPASITLTMNSMNLANFGDRVRVYDGTSNSGTLLASYFFNNTGSPVTAYSGSMFVEFVSDNNNTAQGWDATYTSSSSFCAPNTTFTNNFGFFDDGSPFGQNYLDNTDCEWLIQPAAPNVAVRLSFNAFITEAGNDTVTIYDGATTADPILGTFSGNNIPPVVTSSGGSMLVTFKSNGSVTATGWRATYQTQTIPFCSGQTSLTAASGTFDDGSGVGVNYIENSNCTWLIQPPGALNIDLTFNYFSTQANFDNVNVYDGATTAAPIIGTFSGTTVPPSTLTASSGSMLVEFTTNAFNNSTGWEASYTSSNTIVVDASPDTVYINAGAGSIASFNLNSNVGWTTSDNASWLVTTPVSGNGSSTINLLAIQANIGPERSAEVYINGLTGSLNNDTVIVIQRTSGRFLTANPDTLFFSDNPAGPQNTAIASNVSWNLSTIFSWISIVTPSGTNNGSSGIVVTQNTAMSERVGYVVASGNLGVSNDTIFVKQDAAGAPTPTLSVDPMFLTLAQPMGSSDNFTVNSNTTWQTSAGASWITVTNPANTSDTNSVMVTANSTNLSPLPRASFVAVQDVAGTLFDTVFVFQSGLLPILIGAPDTILLGAGNGSMGTLNIAATGSWTAVEGDSWFSLGQTSGSGATMVNLTTNSANPGATQRVSFVALEDPTNSLTDTVVIIQDTTSVGLVATPDTIRLNMASGSTSSFTVTTNSSWSAVPDASWLSVSPLGALNSATVTVTANTANSSMTDRLSFVTVSSTGGALNIDTVWVIQDGMVTNLEVTPNVVNLNSTSGSNASVALTSNTNWIVTNPAAWLSVTPLSGSNNTTLTFTANSDNLTGANRIATVTVDGVGATSKTITVTQVDGSTPSFQSSKDTVYVDNPQGSTGTFAILSNVSSWSLSENTSWLLVNPTTGSLTETITVLVATRNIQGIERYAEITASAINFPDRKIVVAQMGATPFFQVAPDSVLVGSDSSSSSTFNISSNLPSWSISENASWLEIDPLNGAFVSTITATAVEDNNTGMQRTEIITVSAPPLVPQNIRIIQDTVRFTGLASNEFNDKLSLYPNPTSGELTIKIGNEFVGNQTEVTLINLLGEEVPVNINFKHSSTAYVNLSEQADGIYFLMIKHKGKIYSRKISLTK